LTGDQRLYDRIPILAFLGRFDFASQRVGQHLHPVADAQDWQAGIQDEFLDMWRASLVNRFRPAGKDKTLGLERHYLFRRRIPGEEFAINVRLAHPAGN